MLGLRLGFLGRGRTSVRIRTALLVAATLGHAACAADIYVTDEDVDEAIRRGVAWIKAQRKPQTFWENDEKKDDRHWAGDSALAVLALLYAGEEPRDEEMTAALYWLASQELNGTYTYGVRAHVLALVPGTEYKDRLEKDLRWLLTAVAPRGSLFGGSYDYEPPRPGKEPNRWDHSASQYGVLGVWMAAEAGLEVPDSYWEVVGEHWIRTQNTDGGWGYDSPDDPSAGSLTAAGVATLFVVLDQRYADNPQDARGLLPAIESGLDWLSREYGPRNPGGSAQWHHYYLYGVERVGRASGLKYFRDKEWFRPEAVNLLAEQRPDGSWKGTNQEQLWNTCFAVMFLSHGRAPLLFNKLQHGTDWDGRLRDVAALTRYTSHVTERLLNWQIVNLEGKIEDLMEAPVLYMRGESAWEFSPVEVQKIREFCQRGGMVLGVPGGDEAAFRRSFEKLASEAFPEHPLRPLSTDHPLFNGQVQFPIEKPPRVLAVNNGVRTLVLLCERDLGASWNRGARRGRSLDDLQLGANVYLYATDKTALRSRLETPFIPEVQRDTLRRIKLARIRHGGTWDVEPYGWTRLGTYLHNETGTRLLVTSGVRLDSDELKNYDVAYLTGTGPFELSDAEIRGLREYLSAGGTLLADAAGGSREFTRALEQHLQRALRVDPQALPLDSFILTGTGVADAVNLSGTSYRRAARAAARGSKYPRLMVIPTRLRYSVIYSPLDISTALLGTPVYDVWGFEPHSALRVMRNLLLYAQLPAADKAALMRAKPD